MSELRFKPAPGTVGKPLTMDGVTNAPTPRLSYAEALARVAELEKALAEAMEWNWLDDNADETIPAWIAETLKPQPTA